VYARIATFEGPPERLKQGVAATRKMVESSLDSPPDGLEAVRGIWMLVDRESGRSLGITLFDSEDDLRRGDDALSALSPPAEGAAKRTGVDFYEVAFERQMALPVR
jgi:hypothetical protein